MNVKAFIACFLMAVTGIAFAADATQPSSRLLEAADVALIDFKARLARDPDDWEFAKHAKSISSYSIGLSESQTSYVIVFRLRDIPGQGPFQGGGAMYYVDKKALKVQRFVGFE